MPIVRTVAAVALLVAPAFATPGAAKLPLRHEPVVPDSREIRCGVFGAKGSVVIDLDKVDTVVGPPPRWSRRYVEVDVTSSNGGAYGFILPSRTRHDAHGRTTYKATLSGSTIAAKFTGDTLDTMTLRLNAAARSVLAGGGSVGTLSPNGRVRTITQADVSAAIVTH
jgi:hypothetical protein